jgi:hypothetical protein
VDVYELEGTLARKDPACNDGHRKKARHRKERAARLKWYDCKCGCGATLQSSRPRKFVNGAHGKRWRRRRGQAKAALAPAVRLEPAASKLKTVCDCGSEMLKPALECDFCRHEAEISAVEASCARSPRECFTLAALHGLTPSLDAHSRKELFYRLPAGVQRELWDALALQTAATRAAEDRATTWRAAA